jgi:plastocyanin
MPTRSRFIAAAGCFVCIALLSGFSCAKEQSGQVFISIDGSSFKPGNITVTQGTIVTWINNDSQPHSATAIGAFDSGPIPPNGGRWTWVAAIAGTFQYHSLMQPNMAGTITIVVPPPTTF